MMRRAPHPALALRRLAGGLAAASLALLAVGRAASAEGGAIAAAAGERLRPASEEELRDALVELAERRLAVDGLHVDAARARLTLSRPLRFDAPLEALPLWRAGPRPGPLPLPLRFALQRAGDAEAVQATLAAPLQLDVWSVARHVDRGAPLACGDLRATRRSLPAVPKDALGAPCRLAAGAVALRSLSPTDVVRAGDAGERPAVLADDALRLQVSHGAVALQAPAVALSDGRPGETVRVRVPGRSATFRARVLAPGVAALAEDVR